MALSANLRRPVATLDRARADVALPHALNLPLRHAVTRAALHLDLQNIRARLGHIGPSRRAIAYLNKRAAVLVPLCIIEAKPALLYTLRSQSVSTHKGQVAFPGGHKDDEDADIVACALRECEEEIGLRRDRVDVLGIFHDVPSKTKVAVTPVVGYVGDLGDLSSLRVLTDETHSIFAVSLESLMIAENWRVDDFALVRGRIPRFLGQNGQPDIWGMTGYLTYEIVKELFDAPLELKDLANFSAKSYREE